jgi:Putative Ig domain
VNVALRGLTVLVGGTALATALSTTASATPTTASSTSAKTVHSCTQTVQAGHYTCFAERRSDLGFKTKKQVQASALAAPSGYGPTSLQSAYKLPSSSAGSGQRVYIVDAYDDPNAASDLNTYRSQYGLPACTTASGCFQKLNQNGATSPLPAANSGWAGEISLDLDMASAICPNCGITLIEATDPSDNLFTAVKTATNLGAKFVSMSWGGSEAGSEPSYDSTYFKSTGVVYTASTGDDGYSAGVIYPATSPNVVAVGGTSLSTSSNSRGWTESAWSGAGSGCSSSEAKPSYQSAVSACTRRATADVSAVADPNTGVAVYQTYGGSGWAVYGGTSASAPIIASVYALNGAPGASDKPPAEPYGHTGNLFDVTTGSNGSCTPSTLCKGGAGWDGPTGLGTPNGTAAFTSGGGGGTGNTVTVTNPGSQTGTVGTAKSLQVQASDSAGAALTFTATGLPTGLSISSSGLISGTPTTAGSYAVSVTAKDSTGASGSASFSWTISASGGGCTGDKLTNGGFESGTTGWTASTGVLNSDGAHAHAGSGYAWLDGYGTTHTDTLSQSVTIPAGCGATLTYYLSVATNETTTTTAYDKLSVSVNGTSVQSFSNLTKAGYAQRSVSLSAYAGQTVTIKWTGTEDSSLLTSFFVDDAAVTLS